MIRNLTYACKRTRVINATAAGTTAVNGSAIDMFGFDAVDFVVGLGTLTATQVTSIKVQSSDTNNGSDWADDGPCLVGPAADADSNKLLILSVYRPKHRYLRLVVNRGTANAVIDFGIAEQYLAQNAPVTQDTTVSASRTVDYLDTGSP